MRRAFIFLTLVCIATALAACAPAYDEGRRTKDEGSLRATNVLVTVTPVPTLTATPLPTVAPTATPLPTATRVPTATLTPTRTLSPAEARAARLPALGTWTWRAEGDKIILGDGVATLDQKTGAVRWDSQKHFGILETYLKDSATPQDRAVLVKWMKALKEQGIHFITFPDSKGRKEIPPYVVIPTADGGDVKMIPARKGAADFVYDAKAEKILGVFPDGSGYFYLNPDGSFDLAPLKAQAEKIADDLVTRGVIQHPDPAKVKFIRDEIVKSFLIHPWGVTPKEINDFIKARTGRDFEKHFNETWGNKVNAPYDWLMDYTLAKSPSELFRHLYYIGQNKDPDCKTTCWAVTGGKNFIHIAEYDISADDAYYPLPITLIKEAYGSVSFNGAKLRANNARKNIAFSMDHTGAHIGEAISFAIQAYTLNQHPEISPYSSEQITASIDSAFRGGWVY